MIRSIICLEDRLCKEALEGGNICDSEVENIKKYSVVFDQYSFFSKEIKANTAWSECLQKRALHPSKSVYLYLNV